MEVVKGTLGLLVLKTLSQGQAFHGLEVLRFLRDATGGALEIQEGALYPTLHRLERRELLRGEWAVSEKGRRAKYYSLTSRGREELEREEAGWLSYIRAWEMITESVAKA